MPRPKKTPISKTAAIKEFLGQNLKNTEVAEKVKEKHKLVVSPNYVSMIKSGAKKKKGPKKGHRTGSHGVVSHNGHGSLAAAIQFIKAAGSIEAAKQSLAQVEEIKALV